VVVLEPGSRFTPRVDTSVPALGTSGSTRNSHSGLSGYVSPAEKSTTVLVSSNTGTAKDRDTGTPAHVWEGVSGITFSAHKSAAAAER
jgi:hypothetical protein